MAIAALRSGIQERERLRGIVLKKTKSAERALWLGEK